ncbi:MAG: DUF479 domain-containing protein [Terrimonas sp.]|nr:DUF479 domain-containing protein [Terrimonas sp.]
MNYLAHAYLSFDDTEILIGNMISDFVKGKKKFDYPTRIQKGINLHRAIDAFTDEHPVTKTAKEVFRPAYRLYSAAFVDVVYDHFLANDREVFQDGQLQAFSGIVYDQLNSHSSLLPPRFAGMLPYMQSQNWLYNYQFLSGIEKSFGGLVRRAAYMTESETAYILLQEHYELLKKCYTTFFGELKSFAEKEYTLLISDI